MLARRGAVRGRRVVSAAVGVGLLVAGCGSSIDGVETSGGGSALSAEVPTGFDPCTDIPQAVLDAERLRVASSDNNADYDGADGIKWRGCRWVVSDGYSAGITTTNLTVERVRANPQLAIRDDYTIAGRAALATSRADHDNPRSRCVLTVALQGGSLEFSLDNPDSRRATGHLDTCALARGLAEKIVPLLPADA